MGMIIKGVYCSVCCWWLWITLNFKLKKDFFFFPKEDLYLLKHAKNVPTSSLTIFTLNVYKSIKVQFSWSDAQFTSLYGGRGSIHYGKSCCYNNLNLWTYRKSILRMSRSFCCLLSIGQSKKHCDWNQVSRCVGVVGLWLSQALCHQ